MIDGNDPAFPALYRNIEYTGMTLRDYFASQALQGMVTHPEKWAVTGMNELPHHIQIARKAYAYADAMLTARVVK